LKDCRESAFTSGCRRLLKADRRKLLRATLTLVASPNKTFAQRAAEYSSLALVLPVSTFLGYALGYWLDRRLGTTWLRIVLLILGSVGGFVQLIRQIMRDSRDDDS
jgi:F0F1-type ATP synthase assembly protein I